MKVLVAGSGAREHALAWKLQQSSKVQKLYVAPGNPGTAKVATNVLLHTSEEIIRWAKEHHIDLVVIGPDNYLAQGLTDALQAQGIVVFGPTKAAAEIEWSKAYAKQFMAEEDIPTARSRVFTTSELAVKYLLSQKFPVVIKVDGLAAGKGVVIATSHEEAVGAITDMLDKHIFGDSGARVVIEEYIDGFEVSVHAFCDGERALVFPLSKDHKRIGEGDTGANTGGMGTVAPVTLVPEQQLQLIQERIILPTLRGLKKRGRPFTGVLFPGIMLTKSGPYVIEFNARFGDPETQTYMRLLESDLFDILFACATGNISDVEVVWSSLYACAITVASEGYPANFKEAVPVTLLPGDTSEVVVFHAGTTQIEESLVTHGGRVLSVSATGTTLQDALTTAYKAVEEVEFSGKKYRKDIGSSIL